MSGEREKLLYFLFYALECLVGTIIGYYLYLWHPIVGAWSLLSIILVLSPDRKDALHLALNRIKANLIGSSTGLALFAFLPMGLMSICLGVMLSLIFCKLLKLEVASRTAMISVIIVTMHEPGQYFWEVAVERAAGVFLGCLVGVILTYVFYSFFKLLNKR